MKNTKLPILRLLIFLSFISFFQLLNAQQIYVNREWRDEYGDPVFNPLLAPYGADWTKSYVSPFTGNIITIGHTNVSGQGENILISKYDGYGSLQWSVDYNSSSTNNDYGIDVIENPSTGDVYVCGTTDNGGVVDYDVIVLVYDSNGSLQYNTSYNGPDSKNDIPGGINIDSGGNIIIGGTSEYTSTGYDFLGLSYNTSLSLNWYNTYDYASLYDVAVSVVDNGKFTLAGASANSATDWDMTVVWLDPSTGAFIGDNRMNYPGFGYDEIYSFRKDAADNTYITGKCSSNGIDYDIRVAKLDNTNTLLWSQTYDGCGLEDIGSTIAVDASGNVIVGGYSTKSNNKKEMIILKYDASGTLLWKHTQPSDDPTSDASVKAISLNQATDNIYFIGGEKELNANKRAVVGRLFPTGQVAWEKFIKGNYDYLPSDIQFGGLGLPGVYAIAVKDSTPVNAYEINFFTEHELDTTMFYGSGGIGIFPKRQVIVRFDTSALIKSTINNTHIQAGLIENFIKSGPVSDLKNNIGSVYGTNDFDITAYKIFPEMTTSHSVTVSRLGDTIPMHEFYAVLLLQIPDMNITSAINGMGDLFPTIKYCHPNITYTLLSNESTTNEFDLGKINATANDSCYPISANLHPLASPWDSAHVNVEPAWDRENGKRFVKVGVFDTGIAYKHRDFRDNTQTITKIVGWNFINNTNLLSHPVGEVNGHGTGVAGIIGANRNNTIGVSGIAGGKHNQSTFLDSSGVSLHGMLIFNSNGGPLNNNYLTYLANAIIESCKSVPTNTYCNYGLHVMNHSWAHNQVTFTNTPFLLDTNITLMNEAAHFANRAKVTYVACTGNQNNSKPTYPANIDDDWILTVGGTGDNGKYYSNVINGSNRKNNIDIAAPASGFAWTTGYAFGEFAQFGGTSAAAPHVTGAAALLMSYLNKPYADPQNLAPEDVEFILQKTTYDVGPVGYDTSTGWGRLNIGKAMDLVRKPDRKVVHFGTDNCLHAVAPTLISSNDTIKLTERYKNAAGTWFVPKRKYVVNKYRMLATVYHTFGASDTLMYYWPRHSSSNVLENVVNSKLTPRERVTITYLDESYATLTGYVYKVRDSIGNFLGWWPFDTTMSKTQMTYSILREDTAFDVGVHESNIIKPSVKVFPNPTAGDQILEIVTAYDGNCKVEIFDLLGRRVYNKDRIKLEAGINRTQIPTNNLPSGMYIYSVKLNEEEFFYKILKE